MQKFKPDKPFLLFAVTATITGCLYLFSASTRLTWANYANDSGDFLAALLTAGIPHPTGYPTYMVLGGLLQKIPLVSPYFKAILISLIPAACSAGFTSVLFHQYFPQPKKITNLLFPLFTGLAWGLSPFLWSQATIVEVHGLQSLFIILAIAWILELTEASTPPAAWKLLLLAFIFGLGLGNHVTLLLFLPAIITASFSAYRKSFPIKILCLQPVLLLLGALIYVYIPIQASQFPPINWGNASTWQGFWWLISGEAYQNLILDISFLKILSRISALSAFLRQQFGFIGIILAIIGIVQFEFRSKFTKPIFIYIFLVFAVFAIIYGTDDSITYLLSSFAIFSIWIGLSFSIIHPWTWKKIPLGSLELLLAAAWFIISIPKTFQNVDVRTKTAPADFAETILPQLPADAILATAADPDSFPLWYYHFGLNWREDITIFTMPLTQFRWYQETLIHTYANINFPAPIQPLRNGNQSWGEQVSRLNPDHPYCISEIIRAETSQINMTCNTGEAFIFQIDLNK